MMNPQKADLALKTKNPRRVSAGLTNGLKRRPWSEQDRQRLREQCLQRQPWLRSCGPRTQLGKYRSRANGFLHRLNPESVRQIQISLGDVDDMMVEMAELRRSILGQ